MFTLPTFPKLKEPSGIKIVDYCCYKGLEEGVNPCPWVSWQSLVECAYHARSETGATLRHPYSVPLVPYVWTKFGELYAYDYRTRFCEVHHFHLVHFGDNFVEDCKNTIIVLWGSDPQMLLRTAEFAAGKDALAFSLYLRKLFGGFQCEPLKERPYD